jgi:Fe-S cluster assembly protein SufB
MSQSKYNFQSNLNQTVIPKGLNEDIIKHISKSKNEPTWLLEFRMKAFKHWKKQNDAEKLPDFTKLKIPPIDFQNISYLATIKKTTDLVELKKESTKLMNILDCSKNLGIEEMSRIRSRKRFHQLLPQPTKLKMQC